MCMADADRLNRMKGLAEKMQMESEAGIVEITDCIDELMMSLNSQVDWFVDTANGLSEEIRSVFKDERDNFMKLLDITGQDIEALNKSQLNLISQILNLQDVRRNLEKRIETMVPGSAIIAAQQEAEAGARALESMQSEITDLTARMSESEAGKSEIVAKFQV